jgi:hypothetical protein
MFGIIILNSCSCKKILTFKRSTCSVIAHRLSYDKVSLVEMPEPISWSRSCAVQK